MIRTRKIWGWIEVENSELPQMGAFRCDTPEELDNTVEREEWFDREMRKLAKTQPVYISTIIEYRREWGLPLGNFALE